MNTNTYKVVVVASDDPTGAGTDGEGCRDHDGLQESHRQRHRRGGAETVTLSAQQGQVDVALTATYNDLDNERPPNTDLTWKWFLGTFADF